MDRFREMETFVRVVDTGSFSAAARQLRVGQPAVSKSVADLEGRLGVRLLVRSTRRVAPTDAGVTFYERAVRALSEANEAEAAAAGLGVGLEGRLRVSVPVTFGRLHVVPRLGTFLERHPKLRIEVVMDDRTVDLLEEGIDVALRLGEQGDSALAARKIGETDRLVLASPKYLERRGMPESPADLLEHEGVVYSQQVGGEQWTLRRGTSETSIRIPSRLWLTAAEGVREAVIAGLGLTISSRWMFAPEIESGAVVQVLKEWTLPSMSLWSVYPAGRLTSAKARAFVKWLEAGLGQESAGRTLASRS